MKSVIILFLLQTIVYSRIHKKMETMQKAGSMDEREISLTSLTALISTGSLNRDKK